MTRDEFINLPLKLALAVIWDMGGSKRLEQMRAPEIPRSPRYDGRLGRQGGFVWYSEMDLESLRWWHKAKSESAQKDDQYAERNGKAAAALAKWVEWRELFPAERWRGTRGDDKVTAAAPSREPQLNEWNNNGSSNKRASSPRSEPPQRDEDGYGF